MGFKFRKDKKRVFAVPALLAACALVAVFWLPIFPDGSWLEVQKSLPRMMELRVQCETLKAEAVELKSAEDAVKWFQKNPLTVEWYSQVLYSAETIDMDRLKSDESNVVLGLFVEGCREGIMTEVALRFIRDENVQRVVMLWLHEIAAFPRSLSRLDLAREVASAMAKLYGTDEEKMALEKWAAVWDSENPHDIQSPGALVLWIRKHGNAYRDWQVPFQARVTSAQQTR